MTSSAAEMNPPGSPRRSSTMAVEPGSPFFSADENSVDVLDANW